MDHRTLDAMPSIGKSTKTFNFLLHSFSATGHALPMQAIATGLVARGHKVVWLTSAAQESRVLASGATFVATQEIALVDATLQAARPNNMTETVDALFGGRVTAQVAEFRRILADFSADCLLIDALPQGAAAVYDLGEVPLYVTLGVVPMYVPDTPPEISPTSALGTILSQPELVLPSINPQRAQLGLRPLEPSQPLHYSPFLHIQASCATLEFEDYSRPSQATLQAHYVGPLVTPIGGGSSRLPSWWADVGSSSCVIGITQGTFAVDPSLLLLPAIEALSGDSSLLLVVPSPYADEIRKKIRASDNVRLAEWVPYDLLLPRCRLLITNGGYGSVTQALSHGVPLICAGTTEDKKDTAARVKWVGAGIDLQTDTPSQTQIQEAVRKVLDDSSYRKNAARVAEELNRLGGSDKACDLLEETVRRTVLS